MRISNLTNNSVDLAWDASSTDTVSSYDVTSDGGATWVDSGSDLTHSFTNLSSNTAYRLNVRAKSGEILSCGADRAITATTLATAPTGLTTSGITQTAITLNWTKLTGATTSYEVNGGALTEWTDVGDVATYTFTGLTADTAYTLQVRASNNGGDSAAASVSARTLVGLPAAPDAPTSLTTSGISQTAITLNWTKSAGATTYEVNGGALNSWTDAG
ncbi:MAG: fibronectin type III domain-containing protein, partial [Chloroflexi bacterium]|nr:fibronectin type III domain-containing protein [Chloroflexota bacterium]